MRRFTISVLGLLISASILAQTNYYFSNEGNDSNIGTSETNPYKSINKLNSLVLIPGDKILFKKGDIFIGGVEVNYSGTENAPIVFDSYGTGELPILSGSNGDNGTPDPLSTIKIIGKQYLEFHNLKITNERFNSDGTASNDNKSYGIYFQSFLSLPTSGNFEDRTLFKHFRFSNLHFENIYSVNTSNTEFNQLRSSGIHFFEAFVNDVIIEDCHFTNLERVGIWMRKYASDIIVKNNNFINIGGSAAIFSQTKRVLFENNSMRFCGSITNPKMIGRGSGMWVFGSDDVVAQYNTSQHARGNGDSSGMHVDYGNTNILFQYNYLEDSAGGFCETLGDNNNVIWRYNISVNEGTDDRGGKNKLLWVNDYAFNPKKSENIYIYNNTIYQGKDYNNAKSDSRIELIAKDIYFYNNIIHLESDAKLGIKSYEVNIDNPNFKKNIFFGGNIRSEFKNLDATRREINARFLDKGRKDISGYKLMSFSTAIGDAFTFSEPSFPLAGQGIFKDITSKATKDIFGNIVNLSTSTNIGAYNGSGEINSFSEIVLEAENAQLEGGASLVNCENASEKEAVNAASSGKKIVFNNVSTSEEDLFIIKIFYLNPAVSTIKLSINNIPENITIPFSDGFCFQSGNPTSFHVLKRLNSGENTITIEQGIIDKIEINSLENATLKTVNNLLIDGKEMYLEKSLISKNEFLKLIFKEVSISFDDKLEVNIFDVTGKHLFKNFYVDSNINISVSKFGIGLKILTTKYKGKLFVKKFIIY